MERKRRQPYKRNKKRIHIAAAVLSVTAAFAAVCGIVYFMRGSGRETPEELLVRYMEQIGQHNYEEMYRMTDPAHSAYTDKEAFIKRNSAIYEGIEIDNIRVEVLENDRNNSREQDNVAYRMFFDTLAGNLRFENEMQFTDTEDSFVPLKTVPKVSELDLMALDPEEDVLAEKARQDVLLAIPGVMISDVEVRTYPFGAAAGHLTGYVRNVTAEDLEEHAGEGYNENSVIGKSGAGDWCRCIGTRAEHHGGWGADSLRDCDAPITVFQYGAYRIGDSACGQRLWPGADPGQPTAYGRLVYSVL